MGDFLITLGLIWGFLGTMYGVAFWAANDEDGSRRAGCKMLMVCAPMWAIAYYFSPLLGATP